MNRIEEIEIQVETLLKEKKEVIQSQCLNPPLCRRYKYCSDTGNYDRFADSYWTEMRCTLCGKRWTEDGSFNPGPHAKEIKGTEAV